MHGSNLRNLFFLTILQKYLSSRPLRRRHAAGVETHQDLGGKQHATTLHRQNFCDWSWAPFMTCKVLAIAASTAMAISPPQAEMSGYHATCSMISSCKSPLRSTVMLDRNEHTTKSGLKTKAHVSDSILLDHPRCSGIASQHVNTDKAMSHTLAC